MGKKNKNKSDKDSLVYSTHEVGNSFFGGLNFGDSDNEEVDSDKSKMIVRVTRDRKNRGGKEVTLVMGLEESEDKLTQLAKHLKTKCGVGGAAKDGEIIVQGNHVEKVIELLKKEGYSNTKRTGG